MMVTYDTASEELRRRAWDLALHIDQYNITDEMGDCQLCDGLAGREHEETCPFRLFDEQYDRELEALQ